MRRASLILSVLCIVILAACVSAASGRVEGVTISFITPRVAPGGAFAVRATVAPPGERCSLALRSPRRSVVSYGSKMAVGGRVRWLSYLPKLAQSGKWVAILSCGKAGRATRKISVVANAALHAQVSVTKIGFQQDTTGPGIDLDYGFVLANTSKDADALNLTVEVTGVDASGHAALKDTQFITLIPAGETFNVGSTFGSNASVAVARLAVKVKVGRSRPKGQVLPRIPRVTINDDNTLTVAITNPYSKPIPEGAVIYAVFFDPQGRTVGGQWDTASAQILPHQTATFDSYLQVDVAEGVTAHLSVDPCGPLTFSGCPIVGAEF
jgi:hypothetical protein